MSFRLDTSVLIEVENDNSHIIEQISSLQKSVKEDLCLTIFTFCEFYYGAMNKSEKNKEKVKERLNQYGLLNTSQASAVIFCELLHQLQKRGKTIPHFDLFIAALALEHNLTLLTTDQHFREIPGLKVHIFEL